MTRLSLWLFLLNAASTLYMVGVILTVQLVHYPLMGQVGAEQFRAYHAAHTARMSWVVLLPMVMEIGTSGLLALLPASTNGSLRPLLWAGFALAMLTWAATFFLSVPLHGRLSLGFDAEAHRALVQTNWVRTVLWTAHGGVVLEILRRLLSSLPAAAG